MDPTKTLQGRKRIRVWALLVLTLAMAWGGLVLLEAALTPWARSLTGAPTLTGVWLGEMLTPTGRRPVLRLELRHSMSGGRCANCPAIEGRMWVCEAGAAARAYAVRGNVHNWHGTHFALKTQPEQALAAVELLYVEGEWTDHRMRLTTELIAPGELTTTRIDVDTEGREVLHVVNGHADTRASTVIALQRERGQLGLACGSG